MAALPLHLGDAGGYLRAAWLKLIRWALAARSKKRQPSTLARGTGGSPEVARTPAHPGEPTEEMELGAEDVGERRGPRAPGVGWRGGAVAVATPGCQLKAL